MPRFNYQFNYLKRINDFYLSVSNRKYAAIDYVGDDEDIAHELEPKFAILADHTEANTLIDEFEDPDLIDGDSLMETYFPAYAEAIVEAAQEQLIAP